MQVPTAHDLAGIGIDKGIVFNELHLTERTLELWCERFSNSVFAPVYLAVKFFLDCVVGEKRHDSVEVVAIERIEKFNCDIVKFALAVLHEPFLHWFSGADLTSDTGAGGDSLVRPPDEMPALPGPLRRSHPSLPWNRR